MPYPRCVSPFSINTCEYLSRATTSVKQPNSLNVCFGWLLSSRNPGKSFRRTIANFYVINRGRPWCLMRNCRSLVIGSRLSRFSPSHDVDRPKNTQVRSVCTRSSPYHRIRHQGAKRNLHHQRARGGTNSSRNSSPSDAARRTLPSLRNGSESTRSSCVGKEGQLAPRLVLRCVGKERKTPAGEAER